MGGEQQFVTYTRLCALQLASSNPWQSTFPPEVSSLFLLRCRSVRDGFALRTERRLSQQAPVRLQFSSLKEETRVRRRHANNSYHFPRAESPQVWYNTTVPTTGKYAQAARYIINTKTVYQVKCHGRMIAGKSGPVQDILSADFIAAV